MTRPRRPHGRRLTPAQVIKSYGWSSVQEDYQGHRSVALIYRHTGIVNDDESLDGEYVGWTPVPPYIDNVFAWAKEEAERNTCRFCGASIKRYKCGAAMAHQMPLRFLGMTGAEARERGVDRRCPASMTEGSLSTEDETVSWRYDFDARDHEVIQEDAPNVTTMGRDRRVVMRLDGPGLEELLSTVTSEQVWWSRGP